MYKFGTLEEYNDNFKESHPHARINEENTEVVLSCNTHENNCDCVTHEQAVNHIKSNWKQTEATQ